MAGDLSVPLIHARWRHGTWILTGLGLGSLLIAKLGAIAVWVGFFLVATGLWHAFRFVKTWIYPPGEIAIKGNQVSLPRGVCRGAPESLPLSEIKHAYFLRRAVPWTRTGPVLIVESDRRTFTYPRDWFASDAQQKEVAQALQKQLSA